ncbi:WD40 repeat-like protein [Lenzites betulinus]|nr:WD40 repeat-like protein [Lenzites betulinus]
MPIIPPPTPAPSPPPHQPSFRGNEPEPFTYLTNFSALSPAARQQHLYALIQECTPSELLFLSTTIAPLLKRDFLRALPPEVSLHILSFIDDPRTLCRAALVSKYWNGLLKDEYLWKTMCIRHGLSRDAEAVESYRREQLQENAGAIGSGAPTSSAPAEASHGVLFSPRGLQPPRIENGGFPYRQFFIHEYLRTSNWLAKDGGKLLRTHRAWLHPHPPEPNMPGHLPQDMGQGPANSAIPTSIAIDALWVVVGLANSRIHVFSARTGVLSRTLIGHDAGVWAVALVSEGGAPVGRDPARWPCEGDPRVAGTPQDEALPPALRTAVGLDGADGMNRARTRRGPPNPFADGRRSKQPPTGKPSYPGGASDGWGQPNALVVSGGCDKELRIWDVKSGYCIYTLRGHTSTIRCLKVLHGRPIAVSGSRDRTVRVWDVQRGRLLRVLEGHTQSVRCLDVCGNRIVSGSYDCTCRIWDVDTGACLHVLRGHFHQIYTVAFDGVRVASGGLDTTVRMWDAATGSCLALLQVHTALVCQLQLTPSMLVTGGSDGRVITFTLKDNTFTVVHRLAAHDSSVSGLQLDERFLVTSGNDGRVRLYEFEHGADGAGTDAQCRFVRDMCEQSESVWKVAFTRETCAILSKKFGKMVVEIWSFKP